MSDYIPTDQGKYPKFYCNKCGSLCNISKATSDYNTETGERNYKYWLRCPNFIGFLVWGNGHQNEGAHLIDNAWHFSSGWY